MPRALRSKNVPCVDNKTTGSIDRSTASSSADVAHRLHSVDVNEYSSGTASDPSFDARPAPDDSRQLTKSGRVKKAGCEKLKTSCRGGGKKVLKSGRKSQPISAAEPHHNVACSTSDSVSKFSQPKNAANCNTLTAANEAVDIAAVTSCEVQVAADSEFNCDADNCQQISAEFPCTVGEASNSALLDQTEANCRTASLVTFEEVDKTVLSVDGGDEVRNLLQSVTPVTIVGSELTSGLTRLSVTDSDNAIEQQQQQHIETDDCRAGYQCHTVDIGRHPETDVVLDDLRSQLHDVTEASTAASNVACHSTGNSDTGDAVDDYDYDDDDDDDDDSWEKMFDESGTMLRESDDMEVKPDYRQTCLTYC